MPVRCQTGKPPRRHRPIHFGPKKKLDLLPIFPILSVAAVRAARGGSGGDGGSRSRGGFGRGTQLCGGAGIGGAVGQARLGRGTDAVFVNAANGNLLIARRALYGRQTGRDGRPTKHGSDFPARL